MEIRRIGSSETEAFREIRLECLRLHPDAFGTVWEVEREQPDSHFERMLQDHQFWGGFLEGRLSGIVGFYVMPRAKERHRGVLYAMYVRPAAHGTGLADKLVDAVLTHARPLVDLVWLKVAALNEPARKLYDRFGFEVYGLEKASLRVAGIDVDQEYRVLMLR
ncbi:GNAT family N-acetyltransferase [Iodidimonas sp. SYSU 1G8]|uniref:GNAT family N-acetyltransferase n=1 Tax=Iodidimonas sp. SYSU 1G8 TaxID=3133967 RepID=UPI0031FEE40E